MDLQYSFYEADFTGLAASVHHALTDKRDRSRIAKNAARQQLHLVEDS